MSKGFLLATCISAFYLLPGCRNFNHDSQSWPVYKGDEASRSYSALKQIDRNNVAGLQQAWIFRPEDLEPGTRYEKYECNPVVIGNVMYLTSPRRWLYAIDAETGKKLWSFDPFSGGRGGEVCRGVTYWTDGHSRRILFTAGESLFSIDAETGKPDSAFGVNGHIPLDTGLGKDPAKIWVRPSSPGIIYKDLIIIGGEVSENYDAAPGHVRAFDVRTGKLVWIFHTIPHPGETGYETWPADAWRTAGGANNWGGMSLDASTGIVYVPLGSPAYDYYGANRHGKNLFGNSVVALDAATGRLKWYYQTVHHDLWDYDLPAPPSLVDLEVNGQKINALAQPSKTGFLYVLDRKTGTPVFPVEERAVPVSHIPGEESWPTQVFPVKPEALVRQSMTEKDLTSFSESSHNSLLSRFRELRKDGMFTPPDTAGALQIPGSRGGAEWGGAAVDPESGILFINVNESPEISTIRKVSPRDSTGNMNAYDLGEALYLRYCSACHGKNRQGREPDFPSLKSLQNRLSPEEAIKKIRKGSGRMPSFEKLLANREEAILAFLFGTEKNVKLKSLAPQQDTVSEWRNLTSYGYFQDGENRPAIKPPWGTLNAIDLNTGEYVWKVPLGNHPEWQKQGDPPTGMENWGGPIVTAGNLVFIAATGDHAFRAFDKSTGKLLWQTSLPGNGYTIPATYMVNGRQYVVIAVSGTRENPGGSMIAYTLPE